MPISAYIPFSISSSHYQLTPLALRYYFLLLYIFHQSVCLSLSIYLSACVCTIFLYSLCLSLYLLVLFNQRFLSMALSVFVGLPVCTSDCLLLNSHLLHIKTLSHAVLCAIIISLVFIKVFIYLTNLIYIIDLVT